MVDFDLPPADLAFTPAGWQSQLDDVCRRQEPPLEEGCLTVSVGDVDLPDGLTGLTFSAEGASARNEAGASVAVACIPVVINPGGLEPEAEGKARVGTNFVVDVTCRLAE